MKKLFLFLFMALTFLSAVIISPANTILAASPTDVPQQKLQEDLLKYKYPYNEVSTNERLQLAQYAINKINDQIAHFHPGQGTTLTYLKSTLTHMQELLSTPVPDTLAPQGVTAYASGTAVAPVSINMIYYGWNTSSTDQRIINAVPEFLVDNSPAGAWKGNANISQFMAVGIDYFEYIDGGYEGTQSRSIPNDLQSNLKFIAAAKQAGAYGIFLDEVSDGIWTKANYNYLQQITDYAYSLGLKVVFNTGVSEWASQLMSYCDFVNSSENWQVGTALTTSQKTYASRIWLETEGVQNDAKAAQLTEYAWSKGILAEYACNAYAALPNWLEGYISALRAYLTPTADFALSTNTTTISFTSGSNSTFDISIVPSGEFTGSVTLSASSTPSGLSVSTGSTMPVTFPYSITTFTLTSNTPGTYVVNITGTSGGLTHTISLSISVNAASTPALSVSVSTDSSRYRVGQTVTNTISVRSSGSTVSNASVNISIKNQSGAVVFNGSGTTNSRGTVNFTWKTTGATAGAYTVAVSASRSGYTAGLASTSFTLR